MGKETEILVKVFGEEIAEKLKDENLDVDALTGELTSKQKEKFFVIFQNDPPQEWKDNLIRSHEGKFHGTLDSSLKKYGLEPEEIKGKSVSEKMTLLQEKIDDKIKNASKKEVGEMQAEVLELNKKLKQYDEEIIPKIKGETVKEIEQFRINNSLQSAFGTIDSAVLVTGKEGREVSLKMLDFYLKENYDIRYENNDVVFYEKGTDKKVMNQSRTEILSKNEIITNALKSSGLYRQSNGGGGAPTPPSGNGNIQVVANKGLQERLKEKQH